MEIAGEDDFAIRGLGLGYIATRASVGSGPSTELPSGDDATPQCLSDALEVGIQAVFGETQYAVQVRVAGQQLGDEQAIDTPIHGLASVMLPQQTTIQLGQPVPKVSPHKGECLARSAPGGIVHGQRDHVRRPEAHCGRCKARLVGCGASHGGQHWGRGCKALWRAVKALRSRARRRSIMLG